MRNDAIGGYLEFELPVQKAPLYPQALCFQSARAAFLALLRQGKPARVWMPHYICSTMLASLKQAEVDAVFYRIDERFQLAADVELADGDWLLYVNYFGIHTSYIESLLASLDPKKVIIDSSQALFSSPANCLATIYSPRKFLGVPDGGWLISSIQVDDPAEVDEGSFERSLPLLKRAAFTAEEAYMEHRMAEMTLFDQEPRSMSRLTKRLLSCVDYGEVCRKRSRNFSYLHARLGRHNLIHIDATSIVGPLCYPLLTKKAGLRELLIRERIFVATYWNDVLERVDNSFSEKSLVQSIIPLPCDQRYDEAAMAKVVEICSDFFLRHDQDDVSTPGGIRFDKFSTCDERKS